MADLLLDTGVLIRHLRRRSPVTEFLIQWRQHDDLYISVTTGTEILAGMRPHEERTTQELLASLRNLPVTPTIADRAGRLIYSLARRGVQLSFPDALIAGTALDHELAIITTNAPHFEPTGAQVQAWTSP